MVYTGEVEDRCSRVFGWFACAACAIALLGFAVTVALRGVAPAGGFSVSVPEPANGFRYVRETREIGSEPLGMPYEAGRVEYTSGECRLVDVWVRVEVIKDD